MDQKSELDKDGVFVLLCAMRYVLGRHSYAPSAIAMYIKDHWYDKALRSRRSMLITDVREFLESCEEAGRDDYFERLDNDYTWKPLLQWMQEHEEGGDDDEG